MGAIGYALGALFLLVTSFAFGFGTVAILNQGKPAWIEFLLWGVFLFWQVVPVLFEGFSPSLNFREIARYPVSFRLYFLLNAAYGLSDPAAIAGLLWLLSIWIGIVFARPGWALPAAALFLVFAVFSVLCNRIVVGIFERFQSTRRGRETVVAILLLLMFVPQMFNLMANGFIKVHFHLPPWTYEAVNAIRQISPPGLVVQVLAPTGNGIFLSLALMLAYPVLAALIQFRQLRAVYQGEVYAERFKVQRELKVKPGWRLPGLDESVSAIIEKEIRYIRQNSRLVITLLYPLMMVGFIALGGPAKKYFSLQSGGGNLLGILAGLLALWVSNLSYNTFGMDREGFGRWLLSPMPLQKVIRSKNLAQGILMSAVFLVGAAGILAVGHVPLDKLVALTAGFLSVLIIQLGAGSLLSVYWPKRIEFTQMSSRMTSSASGFASLLIVLPIAAINGAVIFATWYWRLTWLPLVASLVGLALSLKVYTWLVNWAVRHAEDHLEEIASQLGA